MRERVFAAAKKVGYTPKLVRNAQTIGFVVKDFDQLTGNGHLQQVIQHLARAVAEKSYTSDYIVFDRIEHARRKHFDGLLAVGVTPDELTPFEHVLDKPLLHVCTRTHSGSDKTVTINGRHEVEIALEHLHWLKHKKIGLILDSLDIPAMQERADVFAELAGAPKGVDVQDAIFCLDTHSPDQIAASLKAGGFTGAIFLAHQRPHRLVTALKQIARFHIPRDFSLIAVDAPEKNTGIEPALTSIGLPIQAMADAAVKNVISLARGNDLEKKARLILTSELIVRDSTGPCLAEN